MNFAVDLGSFRCKTCLLRSCRAEEEKEQAPLCVRGMSTEYTVSHKASS